MAGQIPPPLPGPPYPVPDLVPIRKGLKRHSIANGAEHATMARQLLNSSIITKPQVPSIISETSVKVATDESPAASELPPTVIVDHLVPASPPVPPTIAESVNGSDIESVYNANRHTEHDSLQYRERLKSDRSGIHVSQESLLSELVKKQPSEAGVQNDHTVRLTESGKGVRRKAVPTKRPTALKSAVIPVSPKATENTRRISLPTRSAESPKQSRKQRWSVIEQPPRNRVSQVANAWEEYFNPFLRGKRSHSTETRSNDTVTNAQPSSRTTHYQPSQSSRDLQVNSLSCDLLDTRNHTNDNVQNKVNFTETMIGQKSHAAHSNSTLSDCSMSKSMHESWTNAVTKSPKLNENDCPRLSPSNCSQIHSTEQISSTFSSISSVDAFVLLPVKDLVDAYVRCNGQAAVKHFENSQEHSTTHSSNKTVNQGQITTSSLSSLSDSFGHMSQASSSTITVSTANTATEEEPCRQKAAERLSPLGSDPKFNPGVMVTNSKKCECDPSSEHEINRIQTRPTPIRPRSVSTPNYPHRPLSVTVTRHRIRATPPSSKSSSTDSADQSSPMVLTRHTIAKPKTKVQLQTPAVSFSASSPEPQPTRQPESLTKRNGTQMIGHGGASTLVETNSLSVGNVDQSDKRKFVVTRQSHGAVIFTTNESDKSQPVGRRRRITVHQFPGWTPGLTQLEQTSVCTVISRTQINGNFGRTETAAKVNSNEFHLTDHNVNIDQHEIEDRNINLRSPEKRVRSHSATSAPGHPTLNSNSPIEFHSRSLYPSPMNLPEQTRLVNGKQPFRGMRSRGIYKRNIGNRQNSDTSHGGVTAHHSPHVYYGSDNQTRQIHAEEPITERTSALSPASQRYEQHIQAQRHNPGDIQAVWRPNVTWYGHDRSITDALEERINPVKRTPVVRSPPHHMKQMQLFEPLDPQFDYYNDHNCQRETQISAQAEPRLRESDRSQLAIQIHGKEPNEDSVDPEVWRDKLGLITRWQREVNTAMQAGETDVDLLLRSPPVSPSIQQNYSSPQSFHEFLGESDGPMDTRTVDLNREQQPAMAAFSYQPHELMLSSQVTVQTKPGLMYRTTDDTAVLMGQRPLSTEYDNDPMKESAGSKENQCIAETAPFKFMVERNLPFFNRVSFHACFRQRMNRI